MLPLSGVRSAAIDLSSVVLPAPFGPTSAVMERGGVEKETPSSARRPGYSKTSASTAMMGSAAAAEAAAPLAMLRCHPCRDI
jgi:hypothetical protein